MKRNAINILILDDDPHAAELLLHELKRAGFEASARVVGDAHAFREWIRPDLDLILLDYSLKGFNALDALRWVRERGYDIPCIVITGAVDDESVSECIRHGAADYLIKDRLARLGSAVQHALEQKRRREQQRLTEAALAESKRRQATLLSNLPGIAYRCRNDAQWTMEFVSDGCTAITGYKPEELLGNRVISYGKLIHPDDRERVRQEVQRAVDERRRFKIEYRITTADGRTRWVWEQGCAVYGPGQPDAVIEGFISDITELKRAEAALRRSEAQTRSIIDTALDAVISIDAAGTVTMWNARAERIFGWTPAEAIGGKLSEMIIPAEQREAHRRGLERFCATGESRILGRRVELTALRRDGTEFPVELTVTAVPFDGAHSFSAFVRDVTDRKRSEQLLRHAFESLPNATVMVNDKGNIVFTNRETERIFGYTEDELIGLPVETLAPASVRDRHPALREEFFRSPQTRAMGAGRDLFACRKDGSEFPVEIGLTPLRTGEGMLVLAVIVDITVRKQAEMLVREHIERIEQLNADLSRSKQALEAAVADLERSNSELDDFAYVASHDLKEPLRGIHNYARFLLEDYADRLDADGRQKLETLTRLTRRLDALIDALLECSRLGRTELTRRPTNLDEVIDDVVDTLHVTLREQNVQIRRPGQLPTVECDRVWVTELFRNLITNAMKYNAKNERWIEIGCERKAPAEPTGRAATPSSGEGPITLFVRDNGIGIDAKHHESVFRIFRRLHGRDKYGGGTGAGLTIVKKIVERHGGRIWLESQPGAGTTFYLTLDGEGTNADPKGHHETVAPVGGR